MARKSAAFFDLDRTLIADSSALVMVEALVEAGLVASRERPVAEITRRFYRTVGETWLGMQFTRRSISRMSGWSVKDLRRAANNALDHLEKSVQSEARALIDRHHADGHLVVVATSTGRELVQPLCDRLGVDHVIASEYEVDEGRFTGNLVGPWIWGPDKADAVTDFANSHNVDLETSYAYSDSYFDRHMLDLVGFPRAVNPDVMLRGLAMSRGWPVLKLSGSSGLASIELYDLLRPIAHPLLSPIRVEVVGLDNIPSDGPCIIAANHRSYVDPVVLAMVASRRGRKLRYLGKKEVFDAPGLGAFARAMGQIRVERGTGDLQAMEAAVDALQTGEAIGIFPQGTIPRGEKFYEPVLFGKTGAVRLALETGAPIIPVALWDTERIWPRSSRVPGVVELATRVPTYARVGKPINVKLAASKREDKAELGRLTDKLMASISALLPADVRNAKPESDDDIARATPPNLRS